MKPAFSSIGIQRMWRRRGLVLVIYLFGLIIALLVGSALFRILSLEIGPTGFSRHLVRKFDLVLWFDYWDGIRAGLAAVVRQAFVAGMIMMLWKVAGSVGLIHAFQGEAASSFWEGVSRFTIRGFGLGLLYFLPLIILLAIVIGVGAAMTKSMGQIGAFWTRFVVLPIIAVIVVAIFDLFHDYARMHLVLRGTTIRRAWLEGIKWPFLHFRSVLLYKLWFLVSAALWLATLYIGFRLPDHAVRIVFVTFLLEQILIFARTVAYAAWMGAEVSFFEHFAPELPEPVVESKTPAVDLSAGEAALGMA
jgi:hypothetical protein